MADAIARELIDALARNNDSARQLASQAVDVMRALGGFDAALTVATGDLHDHISMSLAAVTQGDIQVIKALTAVRKGQRQQRVLLEEAVDRLRAPGRPHAPAPSGAAEVPAPPVIPVITASAPVTRVGEVPLEERWRAGEDGWLGGRRYLLIQDTAGLLREQHDGSREPVRRQVYFDGFTRRPLRSAYYNEETVAFLDGAQLVGLLTNVSEAGKADVTSRSAEREVFTPVMQIPLRGLGQEAVNTLARLPPAERARFNLPEEVVAPTLADAEQVYLPAYVVRCRCGWCRAIPRVHPGGR